jgi:chemotaxis response regulator CheB
MIRIVVAEDSPTARALVVSIFRADPDVAVVGEDEETSVVYGMPAAAAGLPDQVLPLQAIAPRLLELV